jgi:hypothetical protein
MRRLKAGRWTWAKVLQGKNCHVTRRRTAAVTAASSSSVRSREPGGVGRWDGPCRSFLSSGTGGRRPGRMAGAVAVLRPPPFAKLSVGASDPQRQRDGCGPRWDAWQSVGYEELSPKFQRR